MFTHKIILEYCPDGTPLSDWHLEAEVGRLARLLANDNPPPCFRYSTENIFLAVRCAVAEQRLPFDRLVFRFEGQAYNLDPYGYVAHCPKGFCDRHADYTERVLRGMLAVKPEVAYAASNRA